MPYHLILPGIPCLDPVEQAILLKAFFVDQAFPGFRQAVRLIAAIASDQVGMKFYRLPAVAVPTASTGSGTLGKRTGRTAD